MEEQYIWDNPTAAQSFGAGGGVAVLKPLEGPLRPTDVPLVPELVVWNPAPAPGVYEGSANDDSEYGFTPVLGDPTFGGSVNPPYQPPYDPDTTLQDVVDAHHSAVITGEGTIIDRLDGEAGESNNPWIPDFIETPWEGAVDVTGDVIGGVGDMIEDLKPMLDMMPLMMMMMMMNSMKQ